MHPEAFKAQTSLISLHLQRQESISSLSGIDFSSFDFDFELLLSDPSNHQQQHHPHNINSNNNNNNDLLVSKHQHGQTQFSSHDIDSMINLNEFELIKSNYLNANQTHSNLKTNNIFASSNNAFDDHIELPEPHLAANMASDIIESVLNGNDKEQQLTASFQNDEIDIHLLDFLLDGPPSITSSANYDQLSSPSAEISLSSLSTTHSLKKSINNNNNNNKKNIKSTGNEIYESSIESPTASESAASGYMYSEDSNNMLYMSSGTGEDESMSESILSASDLSRKTKSSSSSSSSKRLGRLKIGDSGVNKRESNKAAANRYRLKKQKEKDDLFIECEMHERRNMELKRDIDDIQTEINCIKNLLVEALLSKKKNNNNNSEEIEQQQQLLISA